MLSLLTVLLAASSLLSTTDGFPFVNNSTLDGYGDGVEAFVFQDVSHIAPRLDSLPPPRRHLGTSCANGYYLPSGSGTCAACPAGYSCINGVEAVRARPSPLYTGLPQPFTPHVDSFITHMYFHLKYVEIIVGHGSITRQERVCELWRSNLASCGNSRLSVTQFSL